MDDRTTQEIRKLIADIATQELNKVMPNLEMVYDGVIDYYTDDQGKVHEDKYVVRVKGEQYDIESTSENNGVFIRNPYSRALTKGTLVRVNAKGDNLRNAYISISYDKNTSI